MTYQITENFGCVLERVEALIESRQDVLAYTAINDGKLTLSHFVDNDDNKSGHTAFKEFALENLHWDDKDHFDTFNPDTDAIVFDMDFDSQKLLEESLEMSTGREWDFHPFCKVTK